jgi:serine/threonine protein phosphatase 1
MSTYVMSDIHGHIKLFDRMLKKIQFSEQDHLYILGDIIDKGPEPVKLLQKIATMQNVTFLQGNHEDMMLDYFYTRDWSLWYMNGGYYTDSLLEEEVSELEYQALMRFVEAAPLVIPDLQVGDNHFYLSHAGYIDINQLKNVYPDKEMLNHQDLYNFNPYRIQDLLWDRTEPPQTDFYIITGHTPVNHRDLNNQNKKIYKKNHFFDIDCGCAGIIFKQFGQLSCLRLDDFAEFYVKYTKKEAEKIVEEFSL